MPCPIFEFSRASCMTHPCTTRPQVHLYAKGTFSGGTQLFFGAAVAANCGWVALTTYWRLAHFWFTHRMMHPWKCVCRATFNLRRCFGPLFTPRIFQICTQ